MPIVALDCAPLPNRRSVSTERAEPAGSNTGHRRLIARPFLTFEPTSASRGRQLGMTPSRRSSNGIAYRSEEHTSELQSLMSISYAVLCLQKKNNTVITHNTNMPH